MIELTPQQQAVLANWRKTGEATVVLMDWDGSALVDYDGVRWAVTTTGGTSPRIPSPPTDRGIEETNAATDDPRGMRDR